jgi:hypothetical protein
MNFYKVKFLKNGNPQGRAYTYKSELDLQPDDAVELPGGKRGIVIDEPVNRELVAIYGSDNIKAIVGKVKESKESEE